MADTLLSVKIGFITTSALPEVVTEAIRDVRVTQKAGQRSGFQVTIAMEKGGEIEQELLPGGFFTPGKRMIFSVITNGVREVLMDGHIARYDVGQSNEPGQATLSLTGTDATQLMDQIDLSGVPMPGMPPFAQVNFILARYLVLGIIPVVIPTPLVAVSNPVERWPSQQGTDYQYIQRLAGQVGYQFSLEPGLTEGQQFAYFGPDIGSLLALGKTAAGDTLPPLTLNMGGANNIDSLSISFNGLSKPLVYGFYLESSAPGSAIPIPMPDFATNPPLGPGFIPYAKNLAMNKPSSGSSESADEEEDGMSSSDLATLILKGVARAAKGANVISASGNLDVARYGQLLRPRKIVNVRGAGPHSDGMYFVQSVTTTIQPGSFKQSFSLSKNAHGSFTQKVAV
jgi:hypothetical protein